MYNVIFSGGPCNGRTASFTLKTWLIDYVVYNGSCASEIHEYRYKENIEPTVSVFHYCGIK